jgi:hypothetical protein
MPSLAPVAQDTSTPPVSSKIRVEARDLYLALVAPDAVVSPTREEFEALAQQTTNYFNEFMQTYYADNPDVQVIEVETDVRVAKYGYVSCCCFHGNNV